LADALRLPALVYVGRISYGIYLWHAVLIEGTATRFGPVLAASICVPLSFALAAASFEFIERPILQYSHRRFSPPKRHLDGSVVASKVALPS
jgi:peptidoglycan/LPS O-acetylase OafA/YrhL